MCGGYEGKSINYCFQNIDIKRISAARERRGFTKKALAEAINKSSSAVSQFESGKSGLEFDTFCKIVEVLKTHPMYFIKQANNPEIEFSRCHFRANKAVSQMDRLEALRYADDVLRIYEALEKMGVKFPDVLIETYGCADFTEQSMESFAQQMRTSFRLGLGPIVNMAQLMEFLGIRIIMLPESSAKLDAFASWDGDTPCVMISSGAPASRMQFSLGHELAHLLLHSNVSSDDKLVERIADRFASAFLMPRDSFTAECPWGYRLDRFIELKKHWRVSISAALFRARQLSVISEGAYKWGIIDLTKKNIRFDEPAEFELPLPTLLGQALDLVKDKVSLPHLAESIGLYPEELIDILRVQNVSEELIGMMCPSPKNKAKILPFSNTVKLK